MESQAVYIWFKRVYVEVTSRQSKEWSDALLEWQRVVYRGPLQELFYLRCMVTKRITIGRTMLRLDSSPSPLFILRRCGSEIFMEFGGPLHVTHTTFPSAEFRFLNWILPGGSAGRQI